MLSRTRAFICYIYDVTEIEYAFLLAVNVTVKVRIARRWQKNVHAHKLLLVKSSLMFIVDNLHHFGLRETFSFEFLLNKNVKVSAI